MVPFSRDERTLQVSWLINTTKDRRRERGPCTCESPVHDLQVRKVRAAAKRLGVKTEYLVVNEINNPHVDCKALQGNLIDEKVFKTKAWLKQIFKIY